MSKELFADDMCQFSDLPWGNRTQLVAFQPICGSCDVRVQYVWCRKDHIDAIRIMPTEDFDKLSAKEQRIRCLAEFTTPSVISAFPDNILVLVRLVMTIAPEQLPCRLVSNNASLVSRRPHRTNSTRFSDDYAIPCFLKKKIAPT